MNRAGGTVNFHITMHDFRQYGSTTSKAAKILLLVMVLFELYISLRSFDTVAPIANIDKLLHFSMHAGNAIVAALAFPVARSFALVLLMLFLLGPLIEFLQHFLPGREASLYDQLANTAGLITGVLISHLLFPKRIVENGDTGTAAVTNRR